MGRKTSSNKSASKPSMRRRCGPHGLANPEAAALGPQRCFTFYHGYVTTEHARGRLKEDHFLKQTFALQLLKSTVQSIAKTTKQTTMFSSTFPHTLGWFSHLTEHKFDLVHVFEAGKVSNEVWAIMRVLFDHVNAYLRKIEEELPSEHAKKRECTDAIQSIQLEDSIVERIQNLPRMLGRPLKGEPLGTILGSNRDQQVVGCFQLPSSGTLRRKHRRAWSGFFNGDEIWIAKTGKTRMQRRSQDHACLEPRKPSRLFR